MLLVFVSRTKNILKIVQSLSLSKEKVLDISKTPEVVVSEEFCLLTYSDLLGEVPKTVEIFLEQNWRFLKAVAGSGNRNFGNNFCGAAKKISAKYNVPLIAEFELAGNEKSISEFKKKIEGDQW